MVNVNSVKCDTSLSGPEFTKCLTALKGTASTVDPIGVLNGQFSALDQKVTSLSATLTGLSGVLASISEHASKLTAMESHAGLIQGHTSEITGIQQAANATGTSIQTLTGQFSDLNREINALKLAAVTQETDLTATPSSTLSNSARLLSLVYTCNMLDTLKTDAMCVALLKAYPALK